MGLLPPHLHQAVHHHPRRGRRRRGRSHSLTLVDVREPSETAAGCARGARRIPLGQLPGHLDELAQAGTPVASVCQSGMRS